MNSPDNTNTAVSDAVSIVRSWQAELQSQETLPGIIDRMAAQTPDRVFAQTVYGDSATWQQMQTGITLWASRFLNLGVRAGDIVVSILDSGLDSMSAWLGLATIGGIDAATSPELRGRMLAYAINNCRPSLLVVAARYLPFVNAIGSELASVTRVLVVGRETEIDRDHVSALPNLTWADSVPADIATAQARMRTPLQSDIACITYTSGTTGPSKAVILPWGQLHSINAGTFPLEDLNPSDVFYCTTSHAHFGAKSIPYHAAMVGGQVVIRPRFALNRFWTDVQEFGITTGMLVGSMADMLIRSPTSPAGPTSLRNLFMAPLGSSYQVFSERFGVRICTVYNSTEGGVAIRSHWNPLNGSTVGCLREGYPGFEVRLVDDDDFEVTDGTPGECIVRAAVPWVMSAGYLHNPEATASAWRNGWFHTGDVLVRTPHGDYEFVDRQKDVIRRRGENISSYEVEADVLDHPDIVECAAVAVPADTTEDEILLFAVRRPGALIEAAQLGDDLEQRMARYTVPRYIEFIDELPKTQATQRILKSQLRQRGLSPATFDRHAAKTAVHLQ